MESKALEALRTEYENYAYECQYALNLAKARATNLEAFLERKTGRSIIANITDRIKTFDSVIEKLHRKDYKDADITMELIRTRISDVAGLRIITLLRSDVYAIADALEKQPGFNLIERVDYIESPKPNGYKSLHLLVQVETYTDRSRILPIEIQIRTLGMNMWSAMDHLFNYKQSADPEVKKSFEEMAKRINDFEDLAEKLNEKLYEPPAKPIVPRSPATKPSSKKNNQVKQAPIS